MKKRIAVDLLGPACAIAMICLMALTAQAQGVTTVDLATLRNIGRPSISPSGRYVVYQTYQANPEKNTYRNQWIVVDRTTGHSRTLVADGGEPILTYEDQTGYVTDYEDDWASFAPVWFADQTLYYVRRDKGTTTIHRVAVNGEDRPIVGIVGTITAFRQEDDSHALVTTLAPSAATVAASQAARRSGILFFGDSPASKIVPSQGIPDMSPKKVPHYFDLDLRSGTIRAGVQSTAFISDSLVPQKAIPNMWFSLANTLAPDRSKRAFLAAFARKGAIDYTLYESAPNGGQIRVLMPRSFEGPTEDTDNAFAWSPDSRTIFYVRQTGYVNSDIFAIDAATGNFRQLTNEHAHLDHCSFARNGRFAACSIDSSLRPPNIALIDLASGQTKVLSNLNPNFDRLAAGMRVRTIVWHNRWGDLLFGKLTYPRAYRAGERYPLVMLTYRVEGFQRGGSGDEYPILALAEKGFFVLNVDLHGSSAYDIVTSKAGVLSVMHWQAPLDGMERIFRQLRADGLVNDEVGIGGLSYGSEMSVYSVSHSKIFKAASESNGGSWRDPIAYYMKDQTWDKTFREWGLDGPPYGRNLVNWERLSPALRAPQVHAAVLMNAPDCDYLGGVQQYWELRDHRKPVEMWIYPKEEHTKNQPVHRLSIYNLNVDWYRFWLQSYEDPDPAKAAQYRRWEGLRKLQAGDAPKAR